MQQKDLRTYQRRGVTRESGYHTCDETTGGECYILSAQKYRMLGATETFQFHRNTIQLTGLFKKELGILAFGGYIYTDNPIRLEFTLSFLQQGVRNKESFMFANPINAGDWNNIGFHKEISLANGEILTDVNIEMTVKTDTATTLEFVSFDFDAVSKDEYKDDTFDISFHQKTAMHIPYLYYLDSDRPFEEYMVNPMSFEKGRLVVLKSCNRCGRYLPINIANEMSTLSYSLHCKKRAPCVHSTFRSYTIQNEYDAVEAKTAGINIEDGKVVSYYGHQLECKACKKFFVNAPLNPQRNAQQFKEDGLRRRAIEVLVNHLLETNLIHFEFEKRTKKEFSEYIWRKFACKCFKCKKLIPLDEMHLDHTMPLAYLYRLDETATCLCGTHNSQKSDHFPIDYYTETELLELSRITGLSLSMLHSRGVNQQVLDLLVENVVWFYDDFLSQRDYQKIRDGILTADKINDSLKRVIGGKIDLAAEYKSRTGHYPSSVTIK